MVDYLDVASLLIRTRNMEGCKLEDSIYVHTICKQLDDLHLKVLQIKLSIACPGLIFSKAEI